MKYFLLIVLFFESLFAIEQPPVPNEALQNMGVSTNFLSPKVNPITGEYLEETCDLVVAGCEPLSARRFYNHMAYPNSLYGFWKVNPETLIKGNFDYPKLPQNVMIGQREGGCILLDDRKNVTYSFNPSTQTSFTNTNSGSLSAQTNPKNIRINYWKKIENSARFQILGELTDGSGRKVEFANHMHNWHKKKKIPRKYRENGNLYITPEAWIPYYCKVTTEHLPNGNYLTYGYDRWTDDQNWPTHYRVSSISAFNSNHVLMGQICFSYPQKKDNGTTDINISGSDHRWANCKFALKKVGNGTITINGRDCDFSDNVLVLSSASSPSTIPVSYAYNDKVTLYQKSFPDGRCFLTGYGPDEKVIEQYAPVGPNSEILPIAKFKYLTGATEMRDGENNLTIYRYDENKRITAVEKYLGGSPFSIEKNSWDGEGKLSSKSLEDAHGNVLSKTSFEYDERGNVIKEILQGDLTGSGKVDFFTVIRTYTNDGFNQIESEDDGITITRFTYKQGTNLPETEFVYSGNAILKRAFYIYDASAVCIRKVMDDGLNSHQDDLAGVTYRRITCTTPKNERPCFGLPEIVEEKTIDASGHEIMLSKVVFTYHPSGKISKEDHYDANGDYRYSIENVYDTNERLQSTSDPYGNITTFAYDANFNLISKKSILSTTSWTYDKVNQPITEIVEGLTTKKSYDKAGRLVARQDACGHITSYENDSLGRVKRIVHPDGGIELKEYDLFGNVIKEIDQNECATFRTYTIRGQPVHILYPDGTEELFRYNLNGTLAEHTGKNRCKTRHTVDVLDHPIKEEIFSPDGHLLHTKSATYSPFCKLSETDEEGIVTTYTYDFAGRKTAERKGNLEIGYLYDELGRLCLIQKPDTVYIKEYDLLDRVIEQRTEDGQGSILFQEKYAYDAEGNKTHIITCEGVTEATYNAHKLPSKIKSPDGYITHFAYSYPGGFVKTTTEPDGVQKKENYDPCGRLQTIQVLNQSGETIQHREFAYDLAGNRTHTIEHIYERTTPTQTLINTWEYGPCNRLEKLLESDLKETAYQYDPMGRLSTIIKPDKSEIHHTYDPIGRLKTLNAPNIDYSYVYDKKGRLISVFDAINKITTTRIYDILDNIIEEKLGNGLVLKYAYDVQGRLIKLTLPDNSSAEFSYKGDSLYQITYKNLTTTYAQRNLSGKSTKITLPSSLGTIQLLYDKCLRVKSAISPYFSALDYQYDPSGHLTHYTFTDSLGPVSTDYVYDDLHQLISENEHTYAYDSLNNRVYKDERRHTINGLAQVINDGETNYIYDPNGNLIQASETRFSYDALDRLTHVFKNGKTYEYVYDSFNRRISKKTPSETIHYLWQGKNEIGSSKRELRILGTGLGAEIGAAVLIQLNNQLYIPIYDQRGALVTLLKSNGQIAETIRYTAYGEELTSSSLSPWRFCSKRLDPETNYLYFGRRFYSPSLGRWISPDPRGFEDGPNLYAYVHNSPLTGIDFYGEWTFFDQGRDMGLRFGKAALAFAFPCATALHNLPTNAPMWKRGALLVGGGIEFATMVLPPLKGAVSLTERAVFQIGKAALARQAERQLMRSAEKTAAVALENRIVQRTAQGAAQAEKQAVVNEGVKNSTTLFKKGGPARDPITQNYLPDPMAHGNAHTTLGLRQGRQGSYTQGATFDIRGLFRGRTDVTNHGRHDHFSPHFHPARSPNSVESGAHPLPDFSGDSFFNLL